MARLTSIFNWLIFIQIIDLIYLIKTKLIKRTFVWWMAFRCTDCRHAFCFLQFFSRTIFVLIFKHSFFSRVSFNLFLPFEDWFCCCKKFIVFLRFFAVSFLIRTEKRENCIGFWLFRPLVCRDFVEAYYCMAHINSMCWNRRRAHFFSLLFVCLRILRDSK